MRNSLLSQLQNASGKDGEELAGGDGPGKQFKVDKYRLSYSGPLLIFYISEMTR